MIRSVADLFIYPKILTFTLGRMLGDKTSFQSTHGLQRALGFIFVPHEVAVLEPANASNNAHFHGDFF
jgi:hypothetical protein